MWLLAVYETIVIFSGDTLLFVYIIDLIFEYGIQTPVCFKFKLVMMPLQL